MPDAVPASPTMAPVSARRIWFSLGSFEVTTARLLIGLGVLLVIAIAIVWNRVDLERLHERAQELPGIAVVATMIAAPLVGVPVAMLHVTAGVRFGVSFGLLIVALTTLLHHVIAFSLVKAAPRTFAKALSQWRQRFPRGAHVPMTVFSCLLPGMPYTIQIYLLPVLGVPLSTLLKVSMPLHTLRAVISVLIGDMSDDLTPAKIAALTVYYVMLTAACTLAFRRMRKVLRQPRAPAKA